MFFGEPRDDDEEQEQTQITLGTYASGGKVVKERGVWSLVVNSQHIAKLPQAAAKAREEDLLKETTSSAGKTSVGLRNNKLKCTYDAEGTLALHNNLTLMGLTGRITFPEGWNPKER